jgi:hypothetical protein
VIDEAGLTSSVLGREDIRQIRSNEKRSLGISYKPCSSTHDVVQSRPAEASVQVSFAKPSICRRACAGNPSLEAGDLPNLAES